MAETITLEIPNLVSYGEAAKILGVSRQTIYNWERAGQVHLVKVGKIRFLLRDEVERVKAGLVALSKRE